MNNFLNSKELSVHGEKYTGLETFNKTIKKCREDLNMNATYLPAYLNWGKACLQQGDEVTAVTMFETVLEIDSDDIETYFEVAAELKKLKKLELVISIYGKILQKDINNEEAQLQQKLVLEEQKEANKQEAAQKDAEDQAKKIEEYQKIYKTAPRNTKNLYMLGKALQKINDYEGSIKVTTDLLHIDPSNVKAYHLLGRAFRYKNSFEEAQRVYERLSKISDEALVYYLWALSLNKQSKVEEAIKIYEEAYIRDPKSTDTLINMGKAYAKLKNFDKAIQKLEQASNLAPDDKDIYYNWGLTLYNQGKYDEAIEKYKWVISVDKSDHQAINCLGTALYELQSYEEAQEMFEMAIKIKHNYYIAYVSYGLLLMQQNQKKQAYDYFIKGIEYCNEHSKLKLNLKNQLYNLRNAAEKELKYDKIEINEPLKLSEKLKSKKTHVAKEREGLELILSILLSPQEQEEVKQNMLINFFSNDQQARVQSFSQEEKGMDDKQRNSSEEELDITKMEYFRYLHKGLTALLSQMYTKERGKLKEGCPDFDSIIEACESIGPLNRLSGYKDLFPYLHHVLGDGCIKHNEMRRLRNGNPGYKDFLNAVYEEGYEQCINKIIQKLTLLKIKVAKCKDDVSQGNAQVIEKRYNLVNKLNELEKHAALDLKILTVIFFLEGVEVGEDQKLDFVVEEISKRISNFYSVTKGLDSI